MPLARIKKYRQQLQGTFSVTDILFLVLRLGTILGGGIWLLFAPLDKSVTVHYSVLLAIFLLYSLVLYTLIVFKSEKIRHIYIGSLLLDLVFVYYLVQLESGYHNSFFLCYYLLVLLHTLYFGHTFGLVVATISAGLYVANILPYWDSIHWTDLGIRITFLYLIGFPAGIIHDILKKDKENIENLNEQLAESIKSLKAMQVKVVESEKLAALGRLTETVAHEIRNPLMSLGGFSRRLEALLSDNSKKKDSSKKQQYAKTIVSEVARLESILRDVLLFTAERKGLKRGDLNLAAHNAVAYYLDLYSNAQLHKVVEKYQQDLPQIYIDEEQLRQAIGNLIANSIDAMPEGGTLTISTDREFFNETNWVTLAVSDTGRGMSRKETELIFEPFYSTKRIGTGLGLAIVHGIVDEHRGFIKVDSMEGAGSRFTMYFPFQQVEEDSKTPCWECLGCGIETDPAHRCPAYPYFGRTCWSVAGTLCQGKVSGIYAEKTNDCHQCPFFQRCQNAEDRAAPSCPTQLN